MEYMLEILNLYYVKYYMDSVHLNGFILANTFANLVIWMGLYGSNSALDTLATQAFGRKDYRMFGVYLNRAMFFGIVCLIPMSVLVLGSSVFFGGIAMKNLES